MNSYSYSKIALFNKCPFKYFKRYIERAETFKDSPVFEKGQYLHALLEHYPALPEFTFKFKEIEDKRMEMIEFIANLVKTNSAVKYLLSKDVKITAEQEFFLTADACSASGYNDSMFNGKIDYVGKTADGTIILVDWKSGLTQRGASLDQLKFYTMWAFSHFKNINKVKLYLYFIEQKIFVTEEIDRDAGQVILNKYVKKVEEIESTTEFDIRRTDECIYCQYLTDCNRIKIKGN